MAALRRPAVTAVGVVSVALLGFVLRKDSAGIDVGAVPNHGSRTCLAEVSAHSDIRRRDHRVLATTRGRQALPSPSLALSPGRRVEASIPEKTARAALAVRRSRFSLDRTAQSALEDALARNDSLIQDLALWLTAKPQTCVGEDCSAEESEGRMAAIDTLAVALATKPTADAALEARVALRAVIAHQVEPSGARAADRLVVAEKYDAMSALARIEPEVAGTALRALPSQAQRRALGEAYMLGRLDAGVGRGDTRAALAACLAAPMQ